MIIAEFEVLLYINFTILWPHWSDTSHGIMQLYHFMTGTANNKNFIVIKHRSVKSWNFRKKKKRHYSLFEKIVLNDLQMLFWFHGDLNFFLLLPIFVANVHTVILLSTHTQNICRRNSYGQHGNDVSMASYHVAINKYRTDRPQKERMCPRHKSIIKKSSCSCWILIKSYVCA